MSEVETVVVTGATGTVGRHLVALLGEAGVAVRAVSRHAAPTGAAASAVETVHADLREPQAVAAALAGAERLFLATPLEQDMGAVAERVAEQACDAGIRQLVRLSAFGAGDGASTQLAAIHSRTDARLCAMGPACVVLRPNAFMQNVISHFANSIRRYHGFRAPQGNGRVSLIDAADIAAVAARVLTQWPPPRGCFELTGAQAHSNDELAAMLTRVLGRDIRYVDTEPGETRATLLAQGMSPWLADIVMELYDFSARGGAERVSGEVERLLGRAPKTFEAFVAENADAFR